LVNAFGEREVFMDFDAIIPGYDFESQILGTLNDADVVLTVIGPRWLEELDENGVPRLMNPNDWVRREVYEALKNHDTCVIPVLVGGARMPTASALPPDIQGFASRQAVELHDVGWRSDSTNLVEFIRDRLKSAGATRAMREAEELPPTPKKRWIQLTDDTFYWNEARITFPVPTADLLAWYGRRIPASIIAALVVLALGLLAMSSGVYLNGLEIAFLVLAGVAIRRRIVRKRYRRIYGDKDGDVKHFERRGYGRR
jgi:hypothetical protein